jgi:hypothetical protein
MISSKGSKAPVLTFPACAQTDERGQAMGLHAASIVYRNPQHPRTAQSEQPQRFKQRGVSLFADDDRDRRRTEQSIRFHTPTGAAQNGIARCRQRSKIGDCGSRHKSPGCIMRQVQHLQQPAQRDLFQGCRCRRNVVERAVLIPGNRKPICRERGGQRTANHKTKIARASHAHRRRRADLVEQRQHLLWFRRMLRKRFVEAADLFQCLRARRDSTRLDFTQIGRSSARGCSEKVVVHNRFLVLAQASWILRSV